MLGPALELVWTYACRGCLERDVPIVRSIGLDHPQIKINRSNWHTPSEEPLRRYNMTLTESKSKTIGIWEVEILMKAKRKRLGALPSLSHV